MHEMSLSCALVDTAREALGDTPCEGVESIVVEIGELAGVAKEALAFCFPIAAEGTPLEGAELCIETVPVRVRCAACGAEEVLPDLQRFRCPRCDAPTSDILSGREIQLKSLALRVRDDEGAAAEPTDETVRKEDHEHHTYSGSAP